MDYGDQLRDTSADLLCISMLLSMTVRKTQQGLRKVYNSSIICNTTLRTRWYIK